MIYITSDTHGEAVHFTENAYPISVASEGFSDCSGDFGFTFGLGWQNDRK